MVRESIEIYAKVLPGIGSQRERTSPCSQWGSFHAALAMVHTVPVIVSQWSPMESLHAPCFPMRTSRRMTHQQFCNANLLKPAESNGRPAFAYDNWLLLFNCVIRSPFSANAANVCDSSPANCARSCLVASLVAYSLAFSRMIRVVSSPYSSVALCDGTLVVALCGNRIVVAHCDRNTLKSFLVFSTVYRQFTIGQDIEVNMPESRRRSQTLESNAWFKTLSDQTVDASKKFWYFWILFKPFLTIAFLVTNKRLQSKLFNSNFSFQKLFTQNFWMFA